MNIDMNIDDIMNIDRATCPEELLLKEAIHFQIIPSGERLNRDGGRESPSVGWPH